MKKRILSMFVAATMLIGLVPVASVSAAECTHHSEHSADCLVLPEGETAEPGEEAQYCSYVCDICAAEQQEEQEQQQEQQQEEQEQELQEEQAQEEQQEEQEEQEEQEQEEAEQPALSVDENAVIYNLGSMEIMVGENESLAEGMPWSYKLFDADGSYTIELEADAFFPYEVQFTADGKTTEVWFETPESEVEIGGHTFRVTSEGVDELAITQLGAWIGDEYVAAYPEEKEFTNQPFALYSLLPLTEKELELDLAGFDFFSLSHVRYSAAFGGNLVGSTDRMLYYSETTMGDLKVVESNPPEATEIQGEFPYDLREAVGRRGSKFEIGYFIVGKGTQLDADGTRYLVTVSNCDIRILDGSNFSIYQELDGVRTKLKRAYQRNLVDVRDKIFLGGCLQSIREAHYDEYVSDATYYLGGLDFSSILKDNYSSIKIYEKCEGSSSWSGFSVAGLERAIANGDVIDVTKELTQDDMSVLGNGYKYENKQPMYFFLLATNSSQKHACEIEIEFDQSKGAITGYDLYSESGENVAYSSRIKYGMLLYGSDSLIKFKLKPSYPADDEYYLKLEYGFALPDDGNTENIDRITKAVVGDYDSLAEAAGQEDIKDRLFGDSYGRGYKANYSKGINFTVFEDKFVSHVRVWAEDVQPIKEGDSTEGSFSFDVTGATELQNAYSIPSEHDTYQEKMGYQTVLYLDEVSPAQLYPTFTTTSNVSVFAKKKGDSAGVPQESGRNEHDFSDGPVQYTASLKSGNDSKNYWVSFMPKHTSGPKLFVNGINGEDGAKREVFLNSSYGFYHDIFIANIGDQPLTGLKATLANEQVIKLDDYWVVGGTNNDTLAPFTTTEVTSKYGGQLPNVAKIRLVNQGEGEIKDTLTISADGQKDVVIELTGHAGNPYLTSDTLPDAVKYVPYAVQIMHNNKYPWNKVTFTMDTQIPGLKLMPNGELYGVPQEAGTYTFTVTMTNSDPALGSDQKEYTLLVKDNTNENVNAATDADYQVREPLGTLIGENYVVTEQRDDNVFVSNGEWNNFMEKLWIDGEEVPQSAYQAELGSTKITVSTQTLQSYRNKDSERHTIAAEFRQDKNPNNELKRTAQNFVLNVPGGNSGSGSGGNSGSSGGNGSGGNGSSGGGSGGNNGGSAVTPQPVVEAPETITGTIQVPAQPAENNENVANVEAEPAQDALNQVVDKAKESPAAKQPIQLVVEVTELDETMDQVSIRIPEEFLNSLRDTDNASLKLDAGWLGDITLPETAIDAITKAANGDAVISVKRTGNTVELSIEKGGQQLDTIDGGVKVSFGGLNPGEVIVLVRANGQEEIVKKSVVTDGNVYALIGGSGTVKVINNSKHFVDVNPSDWFYNAVIFVNSRELFVGVNENEFAPKLPMSRAMLAAVLYRLEDGLASADACTFTDVSRDKWCAEAVAWAQATGIISGYTDGRFGINDKISREQLATILYRYAQFIGIDTVERGDISRFADAGEISAWANDAVRWAVGTGLIKGDGAGLNPDGQASRAEVAAIMMRFIENMVK